MLKLLISILLVFTSLNAYSFDINEEDKQKHFGVSATISAPVYMTARNAKWSRWESILVASLVSLSIGHMKELSDKKYDSQDMEANAAGTATGILIPLTFEF